MVARLIIAQILGIIGSVITLASFQFKSSKRLFMAQIVAMAIYTIHFLILSIDNPGAYTGMLMNIAGAIRATFLYFDDKKWATHPVSFVLLTLMMLVCGIVTWEGWTSLLPTIAMLVGTPLMWKRNGRILRLGQLAIVSPCWLVYNALVLSISGVVSEAFNMISVIVSICRYGLKGLDNSNNRQEPNEPAATEKG